MAKYTLLKLQYDGPSITSYVCDCLKEALTNKSCSEDDIKTHIRKARLALSECKSESQMIGVGETILEIINQK